MASNCYFDPHLTPPDHLVLLNLAREAELENPSSNTSRQIKSTELPNNYSNGHLNGHSNGHADGQPNGHHNEEEHRPNCHSDQYTLEALQSLNSPSDPNFEPTVFVSWDLRHIKVNPAIDEFILQPYIKWARKVVRVDTDVVMLTHLILYFTTSVPSAVMLYYRFSWIHGILHWLMQSYYVGTYTLMMHQHIHMRGILSKRYAWIDLSFPYITDPLMGHTWNSYFYHHVKHHHVEGNGPDDLSSTIRYRRDSIPDFLYYVARFFFFVWLDLPLYFIWKGKKRTAAKVTFFELGNYAAIYLLAKYANTRATVFVFVLPLLLIRVGLMVGNWGQHALVDEVDPNSDFRSSITLIDVAVSRKTGFIFAQVTNASIYPEQPVLLQRRIPYFPPPEPFETLAGSPCLLH